QRDNRGTQVGGEVPGLPGIVPADVVGENELVVVCRHRFGAPWVEWLTCAPTVEEPFRRDGAVTRTLRRRQTRILCRRLLRAVAPSGRCCDSEALREA